MSHRRGLQAAHRLGHTSQGKAGRKVCDPVVALTVSRVARVDAGVRQQARLKLAAYALERPAEEREAWLGDLLDVLGLR